ncbi:hypothetical protein JTB14_003750 [Gonioctena quinquepunctata]|nr:hypothetical protein JTB14_003750 [Gonioctena quinquepunctata]
MSMPMELARPDPSVPFIVQTDASGLGIAAVLYQIDTENNRKVNSHVSAKLKGAEKNYHVNEAECLVVVWTVERYIISKIYLSHSKQTVAPLPGWISSKTRKRNLPGGHCCCRNIGSPLNM